MSETNSAPNSNANGKQIQKKLLNYARDFALEKLSKTLDKKLAKNRGNDDDSDAEDNNASASDMPKPTPSSSTTHHRRRSGIAQRSVLPVVLQHQHPVVESSANERRRRARRGGPPHSSRLAHSAHQPQPLSVSPKGRRRREAGSGDSSDVEDNGCDDGEDEYADDVTTELVKVSASINNNGTRQYQHHHHHNHHTRSRRQSTQSSLQRVSSSRRSASNSASEYLYSSSHHPRHPERTASSASADTKAAGSFSSRKTTMAPLPPATYAPLPRRRSTQPAFPVSNAHLIMPPVERSKRLSRARKSMYDDDNDDDEFHTATDDDSDDDDVDDDIGGSLASDSDSCSSQSDSGKTLMISKPTAKDYGVHRKSSARNSMDRRNSPVALRPKPMTRPHKAPHLVIDIPDSLARNNRRNTANDSDDVAGGVVKDGQPLRTSVGSPVIPGQGTSTADYSGYIQKKSLAQGMMDLALLSANINQMRYLLEYKDNQPYFATSFTLVVTSLLLQIGVSLTLIWNIRFNVKKRNEMKEADRVNNIGVMGIFLVTVINVALSTFGGAPAPKEIHVGGGSTSMGGGLLHDLDGGSGEVPTFAAEPLIYT